ncbi:hypothetical protein ACFE04_019666 [Oxalis oulophora]
MNSSMVFESKYVDESKFGDESKYGDESLFQKDKKTSLSEKTFSEKHYNAFVLYLQKYVETQQKKTKNKPTLYKNEVFEILNKKKNEIKNSLNNKERDSQLFKLQLEIEDLTMNFDEDSIFKSAHTLFRELIQENKKNAKDYLIDENYLNTSDKELLSVLGQYTLEALIVHVLARFLNPINLSYADVAAIRLPTLIDTLESSVRLQASLLMKRSVDKTPQNTAKKPFSTVQTPTAPPKGEKKSRKKDDRYPIGRGLVSFMEERNFISLETNKSGGFVKKKDGKYFEESRLFVKCEFDISLIPIQLNLPMVSPPTKWEALTSNPQTISDLSGGYLSRPMGTMYERYKLLSSSDLNHFYIDISQNQNSDQLCTIMNKLQDQPFKINQKLLKFILENEELLVQNEFIQPPHLAEVSYKNLRDLLWDYCVESKIEKNPLLNFDNLVNRIMKSMQQANYEQFVLKLAYAYAGYNFYLPAFLDFRGRIYRCGVLHFHERDLARSLIVFASQYDECCYFNKEYSAHFLIGSAYHYKKFNTNSEALNWVINNLIPHIKEMDTLVSNHTYEYFYNTMNKILKFYRAAKRPFQFLSASLCNTKYFASNRIEMPITQDASASAYQLMSYFLIDEEMAINTNLINNNKNDIQDVYSLFLEQLLSYLPTVLKVKRVVDLVCQRLDRKLVKSIYMPMIYGKSLMSTASDLRSHFDGMLDFKDSIEVAKSFFDFWKSKYSGMECLIQLIRNIGWFMAKMDSPVFYSVNYFQTVQDYMKLESHDIWLYNKALKRRRKVCFMETSSKRNTRKSEIATFVNFIHQKDAYIAMKVVESMIHKNAPIYTVHDNFITTIEYSQELPSIYLKIMKDMDPPLKVVNTFIFENLFKLLTDEEKYQYFGVDHIYTRNRVILSVISSVIEQTRLLEPHPGLTIAEHSFKDPYLLVGEKELLTVSTLDLL